MNLSFEISPPKQFLKADFEQINGKTIYAEVSYFNAGPLWVNILKFGLKGAQQGTNLQLLVHQLLRSVKRTRLGRVRMKIGLDKDTPFHSKADQPRPLSRLLSFLCQTSRFVVRLR